MKCFIATPREVPAPVVKRGLGRYEVPVYASAVSPLIAVSKDADSVDGFCCAPPNAA